MLANPKCCTSKLTLGGRLFSSVRSPTTPGNAQEDQDCADEERQRVPAPRKTKSAVAQVVVAEAQHLHDPRPYGADSKPQTGDGRRCQQRRNRRSSAQRLEPRGPG